MPIGVPRVPFKHFDIEFAFWIDIYNRLYRDKIIFLGQEIDSDISNQIISVFMYFNTEFKNKYIYFFLNSPGGYILPGMSIYDAMHFIKINIKTICYGLAASMGSIILIGGKINKRLAFLHARIMIHQPAISFFEAQAAEFILESEELLKLRKIITKIYSKKTNKCFLIIFEDMERDTFMSSLEAKNYGIIDNISI
uniref:ATP-dependent Clp protease proteolytic subunit n=1 Tax=Ombrophytum subterraneum TaxID=50155 RepID=A0A8E7MIU9_9MAGN|nr:clp protease proteolytic subunit [Ombrophytum subterraneum]